MSLINGIASVLAGDKSNRGTYKIVFDSGKEFGHDHAENGKK
jgi:hypothetical protein